MRLATRLVAAVVAPALVAAATTGCARPRAGMPFEDVTPGGEMAFDDWAPSIGIGSFARINTTAAFTLVDAQPLQVEGDAKVVAARAFFFGRGVTASGYRYEQGNPTPVCSRPPLTGYGPTYPVRNLELKPGDDPRIVFFLYADKPGTFSISGYRITYRDGDGRTGTYTAEHAGKLVMTIHPEGKGGKCKGAAANEFVRPEPGYPSAVATPVP